MLQELNIDIARTKDSRAHNYEGLNSIHIHNPDNEKHFVLDSLVPITIQTNHFHRVNSTLNHIEVYFSCLSHRAWHFNLIKSNDNGYESSGSKLFRTTNMSKHQKPYLIKIKGFEGWLWHIQTDSYRKYIIKSSTNDTFHIFVYHSSEYFHLAGPSVSFVKFDWHHRHWIILCSMTFSR